MANTIVKPGKILRRGESIAFGPKNRRGRLTLQKDGNFVLYSGDFPLWNAGANPAIFKMVMQTDGNLVLYGRGSDAHWATDTQGHPGARLVLQDDGNAVLYYGNRPLWSTNTSGWTRRVRHSPFENLNPVKLISAAADVVSKAVPFVKTALSLVPGIGTGINMALSAAESLAKGRPLTDAFLDAAKSALPGGPVAQSAFTAAVSLAKGQRIDEALLSAAKSNLPPEAQKAFDVGVAIAHGRNIQDAVISEVKNLATDQIKGLKLPIPPGVEIPAELHNGFKVGLGVLNNAKLPSGIPLTPAAALAIRKRLSVIDRKGFDRAMAMRALKNYRAGSKNVPKPKKKRPVFAAEQPTMMITEAGLVNL